jgi:hypothetical protein
MAPPATVSAEALIHENIAESATVKQAMLDAFPASTQQAHILIGQAISEVVESELFRA